ncbi:hypothetical protein D3C87_2070360 [compost metagenome]
MGGGELGLQLFQVGADLFNLCFETSGKFLLGSQLLRQILDVFGHGFDGFADLSEFIVILGLLAFE